MATPTKAEMWNEIAHATRLLNEINKYCTTNTRNFVADTDAWQQDFEGNHITATQAAIAAYRQTLGGLLANGRTLLEPLLQELARTGYNSVEDATDAMLVDIYDGMEAATETILHRDWTFEDGGEGEGTAGGTNNGTGKCYRLYVDENLHQIESGDPTGGNINVECLRDKHHGLTEGNEEFSIYGDGRPPYDQLDLGTCTGAKGLLTAKRAHDGLLVNSSFDTYAATAFTGADDLTGWNFTSSYSNWAIDDTNYYRREPGQTTGNSLKCTATDSVYQYLTDSNINIDPSAPLFLIVRYNRAVGSGTGTLRIDLGAVYNSVAISAQTGWNDLVIGTGASSAGWYDNCKDDTGAQGMQVKITCTVTAGYFLIDEIILAQPAMFDGRWYMITAGATDYLKDDIFTFDDSCSNTGVIQYWISRLFGRYFPHTNTGETYSDTPT